MGINLKIQFPSVLDSAYKQHKQKVANLKKVNEIMSKDIFTISPEDKMSKAVEIMGKKHVGSLIVKKFETPVGIITERDLLSKIIAKNKDLGQEIVEKVMSYPLIGIPQDTKIRQAAQIMIAKKGRLAVFRGGDLKGIITASDLIQSLPDIPETNVNVDQFMTRELITSDVTTSVMEIADLMAKERVGSVIITENKKPLGIFTERDLLTTFLAESKPLEVMVGTHCSKPIISIPSETSIHKTAAFMAIKHIRRLPITKGEEIIGIITARDLVEAYSR